MPELPEVEVIKCFLIQNLINKTIIKVDILWPKTLIGNKQKIVGQKIAGFTRIGKQLSLHLENNLVLLFHLKMTGQLIYISKSKTVLGHPTPNLNNSSLPNKSTRVVFHFSDNSVLYFNDQRKFAWIKLIY